MVLKDNSNQKDKYFVNDEFETFSRHDGYATPSQSQAPISQFAATTTIADPLYTDSLGDSTLVTDQSSTVYTDETDQSNMNYNIAPLKEGTSHTLDETTIQNGKYILIYQASELIYF